MNLTEMINLSDKLQPWFSLSAPERAIVIVEIVRAAEVLREMDGIKTPTNMETLAAVLNSLEERQND